MKYELISGDNYLDTREDGISLTYKIDDIVDLTKKDASYSKTISLPGTPTNNRFFGNLYEVNIMLGSFNPMRAEPVRIVIGDREIISGKLQLLDIVKEDEAVTYNVQVVSQFANLITQTGSLTLKNIDMSEWDHIRNKAAIQASWNNLGAGFVYPYIATGNEMAKQWEQTAIYDLAPAAFVKELVDKIFRNAGYTYKSRFFTSEYFKRLILPFTEGSILMPDETLNARTTRVGSTGTWVGPNGTTYSGYKLFTPGNPGSLTKGFNRSFSSFRMNRETGSTNSVDFQDPLNTFDGDIYTVPGNGFYKLDILPNIFFAYYSASNTYNWPVGSNKAFRLDYKIEVVKPDNTVRTTLFSAQDQEIIPSDLLLTTRTGLFIDTDKNIGDLVYFQHGGVWLNKDEKIRLTGRFRWPDSNANYFGGNGSDTVISIWPLLKDLVGSEVSRFIAEPASNLDQGNELIKWDQLLSDKIKQSEFILNIIKMFNLIVSDDLDKPNTLIIEPEEDYYKTGGRVIDLNDLIDEESPITIKPMSQLDASSWRWSWKEDDDYYNKHYRQEQGKEYGEYEVAIENDWTNEEQTLELIFSPTPNAEEFLNGRVAPQFIDRELTDITPRKVNTRILFYGGLIDCKQWYLKDNYETDLGQVALTRYPYAGMWDHPTVPRWSLEFARSQKQYWNTAQLPNNNLFYNFHRFKMQQIQSPDARLLEAFFKLSPSFINQLDFRDVFSYDGAYWRLNKIEDYNPVSSDKVTKTILYKLNNILIDDFTRTIVVNAPSCPVDMVAKRGKDGKWFHFSPSGTVVDKNCCDSVGGTWANGICYLPKPVGATGTYTEDPSVGLGGITQPGYVDASGTLANKKDGNWILSPNVSVVGSNNYVPQGSKNSIIVGDNNQIVEGIENSLIIGNGQIADKPSQLKVTYLGDKITETIRSTVTLEEVETLKDMMYRGVLVPYTDYFAEDVGIILTAITTAAFNPIAKRIQTVVKEELYTASGTYKGIWTPYGPYAINNSVLYSGKIWRNKTGAIGTASTVFALDSTNWEVTASTTHLTTRVFGVNYDIFGDNVYEQWDNFGNRVKVELNTNSTGQRGYTTITDWLHPRRYGNTTYGLFNNTSTEIYANHVKGAIYNNWLAEDIHSNLNLGEISYNQNAGEIAFNTNAGSIKGNANSGYISYNVNNGSIQNNPSSVNDIEDTVSNK